MKKKKTGHEHFKKIHFEFILVDRLKNQPGKMVRSDDDRLWSKPVDENKFKAHFHEVLVRPHKINI
jgi:hypothetical protein